MAEDGRIICVDPAAVGHVWQEVRPMIYAAYAAVGEYAPEDLLEALKAGRLLLWIAAPGGKITAALITALLPRPSGLECKLMVIGGSGMDVWLEGGHAQIEAYARAEKCATLSAEGRVAWARILPGYETKRVVLEKRLT